MMKWLPSSFFACGLTLLRVGQALFQRLSALHFADVGIQSLLQRGRTRAHLLEIFCSPDSILTTEVLRRGGVAERCGLFDKSNLLTDEGYELVSAMHSRLEPEYVWT